ncbi:fatty acid synthase-like [Contarinia nasturtii]|uniref:fatty acid synthase-like n=1 Tax=Contarinia nasturtii TaxID=265458 RepID=UPI0012D40EC6|nr:fatty acid synthase-like [Contarinia nasturtii]
MSSNIDLSSISQNGNNLYEKNNVPNGIKLGRIFPSCPGEEIVISGVAGRYPNCDNVEEYRHHVYNKIDMTTEDESRWSNSLSHELPKRKGVLKDIHKFDAAFFGIHSKLANNMDPQGRIIIETAYEAILDAGIHPKSLRDTKTGVFVAVCFSEAEKNMIFDQISGDSGLALSGCSRAMIANRISYCLNLTGPSFTIDTACSSSMFALDQAFTALRNGTCDNALVCGTNLLLHPYTTINFNRLGVISKDGFCRPFDENGAGYTRSEAVCSLFLQKSRDAKRIYAKVIYSDTNCDGFKNEGILHPSSKMQYELINDFYQHLKIEPQRVCYIEAHGTGTKVGDPQECGTIDKVFCKNRKEPLLIGSVKSNMGHTEGSSGICSITKVILAFESGIVAPNLNFVSVRKDIPALVEGRLKVCSELTPLSGSLVAVSSFGFGGANAHVLLERFEKEKVNFGMPSDSVPRLVLWAARTKEGVEKLFNNLETKPLDAEFISLLHNIQKYEQTGFLYRGYSILEMNDTNNNDTTVRKSYMIDRYDATKRPIVWMFTGMGSQWTGMATSMMQIDLYRETIHRCHEILKPYGLDLISIVTSTDESTFDNIINSFVGISSIQIAIVNILKALQIPLDYCIGHSVGELGCAYADGTITAEQMLLSSYARGLASVETKVTCGSMAAVGLSYEEVKDMLPEGIEVACHNSCNSATLSGPKEDVSQFVAKLTADGVFAREVACSNIPYHSKYIAEMGPKLLAHLKEIIPLPKRRSDKWISSSVPKDEWNQEKNQFSSAEYHTNNLLNPVLFEEAAKNLPEDAITIEISPHGLLQAIIKKCLPNGVHVPLTNRANKDNQCIFFLSSLGKLFMNGVSMHVEHLYPAISYPVSRGTQMISPMILWDHSQDWFTSEFNEKAMKTSCERKIILNLDDDDDVKYMTGHIIDGRCLLPATSYLHFVRESIVSMMTSKTFNNLDIEFENVRFLRATSLVPSTLVHLTVMVQAGTGNFEISEGDTAVISGKVKALTNGEPIKDLSQLIKSDHSIVLDSKDFYKELRLRGYHYAGIFKSVTEIRGDGTLGMIKWNDNWPAFMDCMLQVGILAIDSRSLYLPTSIRKICINTAKHLKAVEQLDPENPVMEVRMCKELGIVTCGGIEIEGLVCSSVSRRKAPGTEVLESYQFIPFNNDSIQYSTDEAASIAMQIALENLMQYKIKIVEVDANEPERQTLIQAFDEAIVNIPLLVADLTLLRKDKLEIDHVKVEDGELKNETNCQLIIGSKWLNNNEMIAQAEASLTDKGFLLLREESTIRWNEVERPEGFNMISLIRIPDETLILLQRNQPETSKTIINIDSKDVAFKWLQPLKEAVKSGVTIALEEKSDDSGILGLINCIRREPGGNMVRCVLIDDKSAPQFDLNDPLYGDQMKLDLAVNVYRNGQWGAYRHLTLKKDIEEKERNEHFYANLTRIGDLSTFEWMTGWIDANKSKNLINIQYSAINFRDVMLATGRLPLEVHSTNRLHQQCVLGLEYSGTNKAGERLMGMVAIGAMATQTEYFENLTWKVPAKMSLRDAATIPVVYATIYYAFFFYKPISGGKSILIHAGSGGIGLAAIRIALAYGMEVYTTCSTEQKKQFILDQYPQIKEENIGNSRDCSFEQMIMIRTKGKGVDYVLNSLAEDKLAASVRCLGRAGVFLEIGKFDIMNNSNLAMGTFAKEIQFRAVFADNLIHYPKEREILFKMIEKDLESGLIQPLHSTVFQANEVEKAFRYLSTGKHVGKVLIQIRENENSKLSSPMRVFSRAYCDPQMVYIIAGGLGGFGLELADWLILRGCRKLVLSSRTGVKNGYQAYRIKTWESYGCKIIISTADITTHQGCKNLIVESLVHGAVGGIFNLAVILRDSIFENQSGDTFFESFGPKVFATRYLDELSRVLCQQLHYFVLFSSASCGRGNAGQTNYGMANSIMERIIEKRVRDNLPGKAIQWGAVGEVGLVAQMAEDKIDLEIAGTVQQRIAACLNVMDRLLSSKKPVVSSMVVAQKHAISKMNLIQSVLHIMGIQDIKSVSMNSTLAELGMDSLMAVEIKQVLEREFDVILTAQDLRTLTFAKLQEFTDSGKRGELSSINNVSTKETNIEKNILLRSLGNEQTADKIILPLYETDTTKENDVYALFIPGIEGVISPVLQSLCKSIKVPIYALQLHAHCKEESFSNLIASISKDVLNLFNGKKRFILIGHSFGGLVALSLARILEQSGLTGDVIVADGSVSLFKRFLKALLPNMDPSIEIVENFLQTQLVYEILPEINSDEIQKIIHGEKTFDGRMDKFLSQMKKHEYSTEYLKNIAYGLKNRIRMVLQENEEYVGDKIKSNITLICPTAKLVVDIDNDYQLTQYTNGRMFVHTIEGSHLTMLDNVQLYEIINDICMNEKHC